MLYYFCSTYYQAVSNEIDSLRTNTGGDYIMDKIERYRQFIKH